MPPWNPAACGSPASTPTDRMSDTFGHCRRLFDHPSSLMVQASPAIRTVPVSAAFSFVLRRTTVVLDYPSGRVSGQPSGRMIIGPVRCQRSVSRSRSSSRSRARKATAVEHRSVCSRPSGHRTIATYSWVSLSNRVSSLTRWSLRSKNHSMVSTKPDAVTPINHDSSTPPRRSSEAAPSPRSKPERLIVEG